jgi:hypothetical protein
MATIAGQIIGPTNLTNTGTVGPFQPPGNRNFNIFVTGTFNAVWEIQKSYDGVTYVTIVSAQFNGSASFNTPAAVVINECDPACLYQVNCTAFTSGPLTVRIG